MKIDMQKTVQVEAKVLKVHLKVSDRFSAVLVDQDGATIHDHDGYVPSFFPGGPGDYVELNIDIDTGQILNWKKPHPSDIEEFIKPDEE